MKRKKRKDKSAPQLVPGPVTNRRKANKPLAPARGRRFLERCEVDDPGPEDLTGFDCAPVRDE